MANDRPSEDGSADSPHAPQNGFSALPAVRASSEKPTVADEVYNRVLQSDIGINTLLARLKQSIASARDFAGFLHKRAQVEEGHASSLKKLCRSTFEGARRPESRQGTFVQNYEALTRAHEKMADNGLSFALSLNQMHEDLLELAREKEAGRKHWKTTGLAAEKRSSDAEGAMDKAKSKYHTLAENYNAIKTGDRTGGRFGIKGPKNAQQVEEDTLRKMQGADSDYSQKVSTAQGFRMELVESLRPQATRALEQLINECDSALTMQIQKFATFNEKLLLSNGLCVSPLDDAAGAQTRSMRSIVQSIDNTHDLRGFVTSFAARATNPPEPAYERHPTQAGPGPAVAAAQAPRPAQPAPIQTGSFSQVPAQPSQISTQPPRISDTFASPAEARSPQMGPSESPRVGQFNPPQSSGPPAAGTYSKAPTIQPVNFDPPVQSGPVPSGSLQSGPVQSGPPQISGPPPSYPGQMPTNGSPMQPSLHLPDGPTYSPAQQHPPPSQLGPGPSQGAGPSPGSFGGPAPVGGLMMDDKSGPQASRRPSPTQQFGVSLQDIFDRDQLPVPLVVQQCLQAVDLFGLEVEGIYRVNGNNNHVTKLKESFDTGAQIDFRSPEAFFHDVNSVATLLKQFFRELPDPLLTRQHYRAFVEAARLDDETSRRDSIHATINELPDPNYATLRALVLHLYRVQEHSGSNRMNAGNLAICFGPTLMVSTNMQNMADAGWQVRVIDTILQHTLQIFDDD